MAFVVDVNTGDPGDPANIRSQTQEIPCGFAVLPRFDFSLASAASMVALYQQRGADTTFAQRRPNQSKAFGI
jgi:hypothetical protein